MTYSETVFLIGSGYIGGTLLIGLLEKFEAANISVLNRREEREDTFKKLGVKTVSGSLHDHDVIKSAAAKHDITIHAATADDLPSAQAVLDGLEERASKGLKSLYLHTSGTGVLMPKNGPQEPTDMIYYDDKPEDIDALPNENDHREIDLTILKHKNSNLKGKAKIAIMLPPCIYGVSQTAPFNKLSQQVVAMETGALQAGVVPVVGKGEHIWNYIWIHDLIPGYLTILDHLIEIPVDDPDLENPYYFCSDFEQSWKKTGEEIAKIVSPDVPLSTQPASKGNGLLPEDAMSAMRSNSRSRANRLAKLGWKAKGKPLSETIPEELKVLREQGVETNTRR